MKKLSRKQTRSEPPQAPAHVASGRTSAESKRDVKCRKVPVGLMTQPSKDIHNGHKTNPRGEVVETDKKSAVNVDQQDRVSRLSQRDPVALYILKLIVSVLYAVIYVIATGHTEHYEERDPLDDYFTSDEWLENVEAIARKANEDADRDSSEGDASDTREVANAAESDTSDYIAKHKAFPMLYPEEVEDNECTQIQHKQVPVIPRIRIPTFRLNQSQAAVRRRAQLEAIAERAAQGEACINGTESRGAYDVAHDTTQVRQAEDRGNGLITAENGTARKIAKEDKVVQHRTPTGGLEATQERNGQLNAQTEDQIEKQLEARRYRKRPKETATRSKGDALRKAHAESKPEDGSVPSQHADPSTEIPANDTRSINNNRRRATESHVKRIRSDRTSGSNSALRAQ